MKYESPTLERIIGEDEPNGVLLLVFYAIAVLVASAAVENSIYVHYVVKMTTAVTSE
jgi:hypothetical protein